VFSFRKRGERTFIICITECVCQVSKESDQKKNHFSFLYLTPFTSLGVEFSKIRPVVEALR